MVNIYLAMTVKAYLSLFRALRNHLWLARFAGCLARGYDLFCQLRDIARTSVTSRQVLDEKFCSLREIAQVLPEYIFMIKHLDELTPAFPCRILRRFPS